MSEDRLVFEITASEPRPKQGYRSNLFLIVCARSLPRAIELVLVAHPEAEIYGVQSRGQRAELLIEEAVTA